MSIAVETMTESSADASAPPAKAAKARGRIGVLLIAHGDTASHLLRAARGVVGEGPLDDVVALDAGEGSSAAFESEVDRELARLDEGRGVLILADLMGSSPCNCGRRELVEHRGGVLVTGLNLAMLCKLSTSDRASGDAVELGEALADSARRSISVSLPSPPLSSRGPSSRPPAGGASAADPASS